MSMIIESKDMTNIAIDVLKEGRKETWASMSNIIAEKVSSKNWTRINTVLTCLITCKIINQAGQGRSSILALNTSQRSQEEKAKDFGVKFGAGEKSDAQKFSKAMGGFEQVKDGTNEAAVYRKALIESEEKLKKAMAELGAARSSFKTEMEEIKAAAVIPPQVVEVQLKSGVKTVKKTTGLFHQEFKIILDLAQERKNIFLYGPTGCGKSHLAAQLAESLNLSYAFVSCTNGMSEGVLGGRLLPIGEGGKFEYVLSEFIKAFETGGVFLLDEIDACDPNVLLLINAALANGVIAVTNRIAKPYAHKHADFICLGAANTVGTGGDRLYNGRNKLDMATLDRFAIGKVEMDYDPRVESELCPDDELRARCLKLRKAINSHRLERAMSSRFMKEAYDMKANRGWDMQRIEKAFFLGWREDEVSKVKNYV